MSNNQTIDVDACVARLKVLANPHRLRIFLQLASCCPCPGMTQSAEESRACVGELGEGLGIAPSTVSHHIKELRQAGLVHIERTGRSVFCCASREALEELARFFTEAAAGRCTCSSPGDTEDQS